ncbi:MAG: GAF domain-containing protein [FCB group bacterium]|nr:GAF domain-containing protein [FCB group bacterium]
MGDYPHQIDTLPFDAPEKLLDKWTELLNLLAEVIGVPSALIMKVNPPNIEVFSSSSTEGNPYKVGEREFLAGLYCETVMLTKSRLLIPNAINDPKWNKNPDIKLGMISYLGYPLLFPGGEVFGTICILDYRENEYSDLQDSILRQFGDMVESHIELVIRNRELEKNLSEIKTLRGIIPICSNCKKIRDDDGFWEDVDTYIHEHTEADMSHGICPDCIVELYPEYADKIAKRKG